jgi:hypothetical protein
MGFNHLRSEDKAGLCRHGQRIAVVPPLSQRGQGRQSVRLLDRGAERQDGRLCLALPDGARRGLGLYLHQLDHHRGPDDRGQAAPRGDAGAEERVLLRARCRQRKGHLGQAARQGELGIGDRSGHRPPDRERGGALRGGSGAGLSRPRRRAQLVPDGLFAAHPAGLPAHLPVGHGLCARSGLAGQAVSIEQRLGRLFRRGAQEALRADGAGQPGREGLANGVGSGSAEGGMAGALAPPRQWRRAGDGKRPRH